METAGSARSRAARWSAILDRLATAGRLSVAEAADLLGVSVATVRRDFGELAERQLATRNHGGIVATAVAYELPYRYRAAATDDDHERIAVAVLPLLEDAGVIALNGGTTTTAVARSTAAADRHPQAPPLTIVTNALNIATETVLRPHVRCISLGGLARPESYEVSGALAMTTLEQLWFDVAVVGVDGITAAEGAMCAHDDEAQIARTMLARARTGICVATAGKLGARALASICAAERVAHLVTTAPPDHPELARLRAAGVAVHAA